jgi:hypothetical protein
MNLEGLSTATLFFPHGLWAQKESECNWIWKEKANFEIQNKVALEISKVYHQIVFLQNQENCTSIW